MNIGLVSIVMPAYNAGSYIEAAVMSAMDQTYQNWELIVIDDGSTDNTADIVKQLKSGDQRIIYNYQLNKGLGEARNAAFRLAKGSWVAFLDADDLWHRDKLKVQMEHAGNYNHVDVFFCQGQYLYQQSKSLKDYDSLTGEYDGEEMYKQLVNHNTIPVLSVCLKREWLDKVGLHDTNPIAKGCEDWDLWLRLSLAGATFYGIADRLFKYRVHEGGMSANFHGMYLAGTYILLKNHRSELLDNVTEAKIRSRLITAVPAIVKAIYKTKNIRLIGNYCKLLIKIISACGYLLPALIVNKLRRKTN